ncbi:MAG: hypothetical protein LBS89_07745 [Zoogloeaceae bacterium]|nr:hypothetical protein [Zoogloeaceae bacterium]
MKIRCTITGYFYNFLGVPMFFLSSSRNRAFLLHLSASATLGALALILVFWVWYPAPLHKAVGVTEIFLIILGVDVVLGPCLTWTVAKQGKKKKLLILDLSIIITVQLSAFLYGLHTVSIGRPAWLVLNTDRVDLVQALEMDTRHLSDAQPEYRQASWWGPKWVFAPSPAETDVEALNTLTMEAIFSGVDLYQKPEFYRPLAEGHDLVQSRAQPLEVLQKFNSAEAVQAVLARYPEADAWMPMMCKVQPVVVLWRKADASVVAVVDLNPWN